MNFAGVRDEGKQVKSQAAAIADAGPNGGGSSDSVTELDVSKAEILDALQGLSTMAREYGAILDQIGQGTEPSDEVWNRLLSLGERVKPAQLHSSSVRLVMALTRHLLRRWGGDQLRFQVPSQVGEFDGRDNPQLIEYSNLLKLHLRPAQQLVSEVQSMGRAMDLEGKDNLSSLLHGVASLFKAILRQDWADVELVHSHINLATSTHDRHELVRQIARIARDIYNSLQSFSEDLPLESLSQKTESIPDAVGKLRAVISQLEQAANANLDALERLSRENQDNLNWVREALTVALDSDAEFVRLIGENPAAADVLKEARVPLTDRVLPELGQLEKNYRQRQDGILSMISNQSFQDLSGQTLRKVINYIETLQFQLVELIKRHTLDRDSAAPSVDQISEPARPAPSGVQNQEQVDRLLTELGF
jgi:chemotaxis protein CheZ